MALLCSRIYCICHYSTKLREVITQDLLPSSSMIKHLSQEFGLPISLEELTDEKLLTNPPQHTSPLDLRCRKSTLNSEILAHQAKYLHWRNQMILDRKEECRNLIQVGTLSALRSGVPGFCPLWAVQSRAGRYRASGHFPDGPSASGLYLLSCPGIPGGMGKTCWVQGSPTPEASLIAWHTLSS